MKKVYVVTMPPEGLLIFSSFTKARDWCLKLAKKEGYKEIMPSIWETPIGRMSINEYEVKQ